MGGKAVAHTARAEDEDDDDDKGDKKRKRGSGRKNKKERGQKHVQQYDEDSEEEDIMTGTQRRKYRKTTRPTAREGLLLLRGIFPKETQYGSNEMMELYELVREKGYRSFYTALSILKVCLNCSSYYAPAHKIYC